MYGVCPVQEVVVRSSGEIDRLQDELEEVTRRSDTVSY